MKEKKYIIIYGDGTGVVAEGMDLSVALLVLRALCEYWHDTANYILREM